MKRRRKLLLCVISLSASRLLPSFILKKKASCSLSKPISANPPFFLIPIPVAIRHQIFLFFFTIPYPTAVYGLV
ncbi:hypothetical protein V8C37DRAFT_278016 [Trichoderma ceciliae]